MDIRKLIENAYISLSVFEKPIRCTIHDDDCLDCRDHENTLKKATRETLSIDDIGTVGWSPVPNMNPEAMSYFLPRLIELAVTEVNDSDGDPYMVRFINTVLEGPNVKQYSLLHEKHKKIVLQTLLYLRDHFFEIVKNESWDQELEIAISKWDSL
jgi:hypothetical protein